MIWKKGEGYFDPTAGEALSTVIHEEKVKRKHEKAEEKWEADKTCILSGDVYSKKADTLETCFAYIPADISGSGYPDCTALTGGCPGFRKCAFYKGISRHREDVDRTYEQIRQRPYREQLAISMKYYSGKMPWRMKEEE